MAKSVLDQSQIVLDDFYQSFAPANAFYTIDDVALRIIDERDNELEREFLVQFYQNKRTFPLINSQWLKNVPVELTKDKETGEWSGLICDPLFEFPLDESSAGVQKVMPFGSSCSEFIRIGYLQSWQVCMTPSLDLNLYSIEGCKIILHNFFGCTEKLMVTIVPSQAGLPMSQQTLPDGKAANIREVVLNKMWRDMQVRLGKISQNNTGNKNPSPNETDLIYDGLKTK